MVVHVFLFQVLNEITEKMKDNDPLFKRIYEDLIIGGSVGEELKVSYADEFDMNVILKLPSTMERILTISNVPGYVHIQRIEYNAARKYGWVKESSVKTIGIKSLHF